MSDQLSTTEFSKLPSWVQHKIRELDVANPEQWIHKRIPALGDLSVVETLRQVDGEEVLRGYFAKVSGRF